MDGNDQDQLMEDLFGDGSDHVNVAITPSPPAKRLPQRLDHLAATNCCQKIAWSRFGCIAAVSEAGKGVDLYTYIRDLKDGVWDVSKPIPLWPPIAENHSISHITWSHMGNDLTVVDSCGRILIYSTGFALGQMMLVRPANNDPDDELSSLVGLHWLPVFPHTQKSGIFWNARRLGDDWKFFMSHHMSPGPYNPIEGKSALVCLTRSGMLRLLFQQRDGKWHETNVEIEGPAIAVESSFTHASFAPNADKSLLLAAHQVTGALKLYNINFHWNLPDNKDPQAQPLYIMRPVIAVTSLLEIASCFPAGLSSGAQGEDGASSVDHSLSYQLSYLELIPYAPEHGSKEPSERTVMAVFTVTPSSSEMIDSMQQYGQLSSTICRWELKTGLQDKVAHCFDLLSVKKKACSAIHSRNRARLRRLTDISLHPAVLNVVPIRNHTMFAFTMSDGSIQFRYRDTMEIVTADDEHDEVQTMPQSGFAFANIDTYLHTTFSPNACVVAMLNLDGVVKTEKIQYMPTSLNDIKEDDPRYGSVTAALALQHSSASMQYKSTDDLLSILPKNLSEALTHGLLTKACKFLTVNFDFVSDDNQKQIPGLYRHHLLFKCVSIQSTLGSSDKKGPRKLSARLAWITINLRLISLCISMNLRSNENLRAEMAMSLVGLVKWSLDICVYLLQELFALHNKIRHATREGDLNKEKDLAWIREQMLKEHSPAILILLCSIPRILLRMIFRPLRHGMIHSTNGLKTSLQYEQKSAFNKLLQIYQATPISILPIETYLTDVDTLVKTAYRNAGIPDAKREDYEREMFLTATIPSILSPCITEMMTTKLTTLASHVDQGKVYLHDISWLGLTDDSKTKRWHQNHVVDVVRKLPLSKDSRLRICPRCGSVMEDISPGMQGAGLGPGMSQMNWVWQSQKTCICYNSWASIGPRGVKRKVEGGSGSGR
ncbi:mediator of rna polymerase ii transcription subunit 16 [Venturia nashicola]|uniref:Mediator of RNA polymerase II transcription subunit 16 n=1 Tax=Venturia nashicola TaxID=86259 RepID=A0A4Z1P1B0_9PEZI|nr:mediator of rna polymerase ii transcription subunit 16 [Venturia nashicola]TLD34632.1 mediator of rna polymerase ii transcription subunit 16 [Venturia nashicola]